MPLAREPSQRSKWMRWHNNNNNNSNSAPSAATANNTSKHEPAEIIHLGGARISDPPPTITEERPVTQWFTVPPPDLPASSPDRTSQDHSQDKQLPSPPLSATSSMLSPPPLNIGGQTKGKPPAPVQIPAAHQRMLSPLHSDASNGESAFSPPLTGSSSNTRGSAAMFSPAANPFACNPVSPSSSVSSNDSPDHGLRRSRSVADIKDRSRDLSRSNTAAGRLKWRPFPNSTPSESDGETDDIYARQPATSRIESSSSARTYPPPSHPPPSGPLPAISQVLSMGEQQQQQQQQRPTTATAKTPAQQQPSAAPLPVPGQTGQVSSLTRSSSLNRPTVSLVVNPKIGVAKTTRHTREERLWLHRNYRGEANFLRAWGLSIDNEEDRDEGAALLRELCQSEQEAKWSKSQQQQQQTPAAAPPYGYKYPGVMVEETPVTTIVAADHEDGVNLRIPVKPPWSNSVQQHQQQQHLARVAAAANKDHARSESEHSVLGAYLDVRMSRLD
ncbi:hypothetical protein PG985_009986 [Apiospora marii]|uniref:uncharacterized protein n=1 Tax=Apiospora marii TaxID=335849 RepID=UPI0031321588